MAVRHTLALTALILLPAVAFAAPPEAIDDSRSTRINTPLTINVLNNDGDPDGDAIELVEVSAPANGTVTVNADGGVLYTPNENFTGTDIFNYVIRDNSVAAETDIGSVVIQVFSGTLAPLSAGGNQASVAAALDSACAAVSATPPAQRSAGMEQLNERCLYLQNLAASDPAAAAELINQVAPEETLALLRTASSGVETQATAVAGRMGQLGHGISAMTINGLTWSTDDALGGAAGDGYLFSRFGVFANLQIDVAEKDRTEFENGFEFDAYSFTFGGDYAVHADLFIGGAFGYTANDLQYSNDNGSVEAEIFSFIGYSSFTRGNFGVNGQLGYGISNYDISRHIVFPDGARPTARTQGSTTGDQLFASTQAQYLFSYNALSVYPSLTLNYLTSTIEDYAELNADGFEVILGEQNISQLSAQLGLQAQYALNLSWGVLLPAFELSAIGELASDQDDVIGEFAFAPDDSENFALTAEERESLFYRAGVGASIVLPRGFNAYFNYNHLFGYANFEAFQVQAGLRYEL